MRVLLCYVSANGEAAAFVRRYQMALVPGSLLARDMIKSLNLEFSMSVYSGPAGPNDLERHLFHACKSVDAVCVLLDSSSFTVAPVVRSSCFVADMVLSAPASNYRNEFTRQISKILPNFASLVRLIKDGDNLQAMGLPTRNFNAQQLRDLATLLANGTLSNIFTRDLGASVAGLHKRREQMQQHNPNEKYYVDDSGKYFRYGPERHS
jgi:hypothetical protein